jgi:hypothetical protein
MDQYISPFNVGFGVVVTAGTPNYTIQHTFDDVFAANYNPATGNWFPHPTVQNASSNQDGNYAFPVSAIRLTINSGAGTAQITLKQAGI